MGMICQYFRLGPEGLAKAVNDPERIDELLATVNEDALDVEAVPEAARFFDIDKSWDGIRYLIAARGGAPVDVIHGGTPLPPAEQWDYGPPRYLTVTEVSAAAAFLECVSVRELSGHFDPALMSEADVYLPGPVNDDDQEYFGHHYERLTCFFTAAAQAGDAIVVMLI